MKRFLSVISFVFVVSFSSLAQTSSQKDWVTFAPQLEEFSVEVPASPSSSGFGDTSRRYKNIFDGMYFYIFSDANKNPSQSKVVLNFVKEFQAVGDSFPVANFQGEKYSFTDADGFYQTILVVKTRKRTYTFQAISETQINPQVERFFDGIQFDQFDKKPSDQNKAASDGKAEEDKNNGSRYGSSSGIGNGATPTNSQTPAIETTALQITSKPRPAYTDFARFYEISGNVRLRVIFLASGEIGSVSPVTKLPFGLMQQAIKAAQGIKFEPAKRDGQPLNVTKLIEYGFTIY